MLRQVFILVTCFVYVFGRPEAEQDDRYMHNYINRPRSNLKVPANQDEQTAAFWRNQAQKTLDEQLLKEPNTVLAKNVILFLGDGMSIPTLAAARAYIGQKNGKPGEETKLSFEKFPYTGLSKTYCVDRQVADSACSATAYLCGVKANEATIGVTAAVAFKDCAAMTNTSNHVDSIGRWSQLQRKRTGIVTTTRITHASPSGVYAHTANRDWESDTDVQYDNVDPDVCPDIAHQLIYGETASEFNVILGGGRAKFLPKEEQDEDGKPGERSDKRNLINEWKQQKEAANKLHKYISNRDELLEVPEDTEYVLGLFASDHIDYRLDRTKKQPSLTEMTETAIKLLSKSQDGYFLFVEGGRIDHAHHDTLARKALDETEEFHQAIAAALNLTDPKRTLIVVTADHAHTMSVSGYPNRGNDILNIGGMGDDKLPYTTLTYANGPGYRKEKDGKRYDVTNDDFNDKDYKYISLFPLEAETHGGDDVGIYATGPWSHLFTGVLEQNVIPHLMAYASCVGDGKTLCSSSGHMTASLLIPIIALLLIVKRFF